jgi:hypothetical protein
LAVDAGEYLKIPLGTDAKDGFAIISREDRYLEKHKWHLSNTGYSVRNRTDNRRNNLRVVTRQINALNTGIRSNNTSGYKGVSYNKVAHKFGARITRNGINRHLGLFDTPEKAYQAYLTAAEVLDKMV